MSEMAAREMTPEEWAERLAGKDRTALAIALKAMEERGYHRGVGAIRPAADHFEVAYRYAVNAHNAGADAVDLLASAETFANIGYETLRKQT